VAFSPDGKAVGHGQYDDTARVWDVVTGRQLLRLQHGDWVSAVAFSPTGNSWPRPAMTTPPRSGM